MLKQCNFFAVFVGIESPDPETLIQMRKKQNTRRNIAECIQKIYSYGIFVTAGFIVGFDNEKGSIADAMADLDRGMRHPDLHRRPALCPSEHAADAPAGRGRPPQQRSRRGRTTTTKAISAFNGINFAPLRPLRDVLLDYRRVLEQIYDPVVYAGRLDRLASMLNRKGRLNNGQKATARTAWPGSRPSTASSTRCRKRATFSGRRSSPARGPIRTRCATSCG